MPQPTRSPIPEEEFDRRIRELEERSAKLLDEHRAAEKELAWWREGKRLFLEGDPTTIFISHAATPPENGSKPTLRSAIKLVMHEMPTSEWRNEVLIDGLEKRGWLPNGKNALQTVRDRVADMAGKGELVRVARGTYRLPPDEVRLSQNEEEAPAEADAS
jgi:hypothetical protein